MVHWRRGYIPVFDFRAGPNGDDHDVAAFLPMMIWILFNNHYDFVDLHAWMVATDVDTARAQLADGAWGVARPWLVFGLFGGLFVELRRITASAEEHAKTNFDATLTSNYGSR